MQEMQVRFLFWEDPLEKEMPTHSSIFGLGNAMDKGDWWAAVHELQRVGHNAVTETHLE